jgi:hypothetical protein
MSSDFTWSTDGILGVPTYGMRKPTRLFLKISPTIRNKKCLPLMHQFNAIVGRWRPSPSLKLIISDSLHLATTPCLLIYQPRSVIIRPKVNTPFLTTCAISTSLDWPEFSGDVCRGVDAKTKHYYYHRSLTSFAH